jgi:AcrR family transcriptional regulator
MGRIAGVAPEETRARLVDAAVEVFAERGYEGARVTDIARRAGLSSGAIYAHYTSKAELLVDAIRARGTDEVNRLLTPDGDSRTPLSDVLIHLGEALEHRDETQTSLLLEAMAASRRDAELTEVLSTGLWSREALIAGVTRHSQRRDDIADDIAPEALARFCTMVALGALVARIVDMPRIDPSDWSHLITRLVDGIRAEENTP